MLRVRDTYRESNSYKVKLLGKLVVEPLYANE